MIHKSRKKPIKKCNLAKKTSNTSSKRKNKTSSKIVAKKSSTSIKDTIAKKILQAREIVKNKSKEVVTDENESLNLNYISRKSKNAREESILFFYTNDKYFTEADDAIIIDYIQQYYPLFMKEDVPDCDLKKIVVLVLEDRLFVRQVLEFFSLSILDFVKIMLRNGSLIFKGPYISKILQLIKNSNF